MTNMRMRSASPTAIAPPAPAATTPSTTRRPTTHTNATAALAAARRSSNLRIVTRVPKFLRCLYDILHVEDPSILAWAADGAFFQILNTARLEAEVLPKYFKHSKFASFQRQLNNFGFRKWTKTQSSVCTFSHHLYVQRSPSDLVELVIAHNEATSREQCDERDERDERVATVGSDVSAPIARMATVSAAVASASPKRSPTKKRKRVAAMAPASAMGTADNADFFSCKTQHRAGVMYAGRGLSFQEQLSSSVNSWGFLAPADPVEWQQPEPTQQHMQHMQQVPVARRRLLSMKSELGSETPTSAAALNDLAFNVFTMEELDDILFTTSEPAYYSSMAPIAAVAANIGFGVAAEHFFDTPRFAMSEAVDASVGCAAAPLPPADVVDHAETVRFLNEMFAKPENEFWLPC